MKAILATVGIVLALTAPVSLAGPSNANVQVLGPFTVTAAQVASHWDAKEHVGDVQVATLPRGALILDFWAEVPTAFAGADVHYTLEAAGISLSGTSGLRLDLADTNTGTLIVGNFARRATLGFGDAKMLLPARTLAPVPMDVCVWTDDQPPSAGEMRVYLEVAP